MKAFNKTFNFYQLKNGTDTGKVVINFDNFTAIKATFDADELYFFSSLFTCIPPSNKQVLNATKKAFTIINGLLQLDIDKDSRVAPVHKLVDSFNVRSLFIAQQFLTRYQSDNSAAYDALRSIDDRLTRFNY